MEQKRVGKFQIEIGWLLVIGSTIIGIVGYWLIFSRLVITFSDLTETWRVVAANDALQSGLIPGHVVSYVTLLSSIHFIGLVLLGIFVFLLFFIGILFITQGTSNSNLAKSIKQDELNTIEAKKRFRNVIKISFIFTLIGSLLFFKPYYDYFYGPKYGVVFGFPSDYVYYLQNTLINFSLYGFMINLLFALVVSYGIGLIYYRLILGFKKF